MLAASKAERLRGFEVYDELELLKDLSFAPLNQLPKMALEDYDTRVPLRGHCGEPGCPRKWDGQRTTFHLTPNPIAMTGWVNADKQPRCLQIWWALLRFQSAPARKRPTR